MWKWLTNHSVLSSRICEEADGEETHVWRAEMPDRLACAQRLRKCVRQAQPVWDLGAEDEACEGQCGPLKRLGASGPAGEDHGSSWYRSETMVSVFTQF